MNKADILAALESKFEAVLDVTKRSEVAGVRYYVANVFDTSGAVGRTINLMFFVKDEGSQDETAYWGNSEPKPAPGPATFAQEAQAWLQSKIDATVGDKIVRMFDQLSADNVQERARVRLTLEDAQTGDLSEITAALWKDAQGNFQYKVITA
jgi:hypothetical protein